MKALIQFIGHGLYCVIFTAEQARFEKFSKTLIVVEASDRKYEKVLGHRLEVVPTTDPTVARISTCSRRLGFSVE